jgi:hypothetical protein
MQRNPKQHDTIQRNTTTHFSTTQYNARKARNKPTPRHATQHNTISHRNTTQRNKLQATQHTQYDVTHATKHRGTQHTKYSENKYKAKTQPTPTTQHT